MSVSYLIDNDSADEINGFDSRTRWSSTDTGTLDEHLAELVRIFRESCPRMKSFTLEMVTGSSPHPLRNYSTADIEVSGKRTTTGLFGKTLAYNVRKELKKMVCSEEGCLKRVRLVAVTESGEDGKTMQIVGAGSTRWHEIEYRLTDDEPMWVFMVDKVFKKDRKKADRR